MNKLEKYTSATSRKVKSWYRSARAMYSEVLTDMIEEAIDVMDGINFKIYLGAKHFVNGEEHRRLRRILPSSANFIEFTGTGKKYERTLTATPNLSSQDIRRCIDYFGTRDAGVMVRDLESLAPVYVSLCQEMTTQFGALSEEELSKKLHFPIYHERFRALLDWYQDSESDADKAFLWRWYGLSDLGSIDFLSIHDKWSEIISAREDPPSNTRVYLNFLKDYELDLGTKIPISAFEKIRRVRKWTIGDDYLRFRQGLITALKSGIVHDWLDHIIDQLSGETTGGSNYREVAT